MDKLPGTFDFYDTWMRSGIEMRAAMLDSAKRVRQYQLEQIEAALAEHAEIFRQQKSTSDPSRIHQLSMSLLNRQYEKSMNYWVGMSNVMTQNCLAMTGTLKNSSANAAAKLQEHPDASLTATALGVPETVLSALNAGLESTMAGIRATQQFAMEGANALVSEHHSEAAASPPARAHARRGPSNGHVRAAA